MTPQSHAGHISACLKKIGGSEATLRNELYRRAREAKSAGASGDDGLTDLVVGDMVFRVSRRVLDL